MKISIRNYPLILIIFSLIVRGLYFYQFQVNPYFDYVPDTWDQAVYYEGGKAFSSGDILARAPNHSNKFSPLYQYFLGVIFWFFGSDLQVVWGVQFILGTLSTILIYFIANFYFRHFSLHSPSGSGRTSLSGSF